MSDVAPAIGIDLGTTNSCAAVLLDDQITVIHGDDGMSTISSFVFFDKSGGKLVGNSARKNAFRNPKNGIYGVKRFIGRTYKEFENEKTLSTFPYTIENRDNKPTITVKCKETMDFTAEEISAMVLSKVKDCAEEVLIKKISKAVITVPAHFNGVQRQATIDAGRIAGLQVLRVINEPTAAILAFDLTRKYKDKNCNVLVYDFGGGTFDVSIATIRNEEIQVKASNGEAFLGGDDLNNNLIEYCIERCKKQHNIDLRKSYKAVDRLRQKAEHAKKTLSQLQYYDIVIDCIDDNMDLDFECSITRPLFENINLKLFDKTLKCIDKTLEHAGMKKEEINEILLVGGSTRIPYVRKIVKEYFGKEPNTSVNPDEVVAIGAARQAAMSSSKNYCKKLTNLKLSDVCSLSLGINLVFGRMGVIIPRNTKIPTKKTKRYYTESDYQKSIRIGVYEGEMPMYADNIFLSECVLNGIKIAPAGKVECDVTFDIDESGILTATAVEVGTENSASLTVSIFKNNLTETQIKEMINKSQKFKEAEEERKRRLLSQNQMN